MTVQFGQRRLRELGLFAGAGGGLLASHLIGLDTVCAVEIDGHCQRVLAQRQRDGMLPTFPIWGDIRTFDGKPWNGCVDVISGGFPCQDISSAGSRRGLDGTRSGLWFEMLRVIGEVRPAFVFAENSPRLRVAGLQRCLEGLASLGFDAAWGVLGAHHVGAPHKRDRMWIVAAHTDRCWERGLAEHAEVASAPSAGDHDGDADRERERCTQHESPERTRHAGDAADANGNAVREQPGRGGGTHGQEAPVARGSDWWCVDRFAGVDDGMASRVERVRATGNGQVPAVAALAWRVLSSTLDVAQSGVLT